MDNTMDIDSLAEQISNCRIYTEEGSVVGNPFLLRFTTPVDVEAFYETVFQVEEPWRLWGVKTGAVEGDEDTVPTLTVKGLAMDVDDGVRTGQTDVQFEISPTSVRVYVKGEDASVRRIAELLEKIRSEFPFEYDGFGS